MPSVRTGQAPSEHTVICYPTDAVGPELRRPSVDEHIKYCLRAAILTQVGERPLNPTLGSDIRDFLFRPLSPSLKVELQTMMRELLTAAEPRVEIDDLEVTVDRQDTSRAIVRIDYQQRVTKKRDQVSFKL